MRPRARRVTIDWPSVMVSVFFISVAVVIVYKSVAAAEHSKRRERGQRWRAECGFAVAQGAEMIALRA
jgi:hypothetical protein